MGVPVASLIGQTSVGRTGASLLRAVGLPELLAHSTDEYATIATSLASNTDQLKQWRRSLREILAASPIMNERKYTADLESLYRQAWRSTSTVIWASGP